MKLEAKNKVGIKTWYYDFTLSGKRYRGWLQPISNMTKRQANTKLRKIKLEILGDALPRVKTKKKGANLIKLIFDEYEEYLKTHKPKSYCGRMEYMFKNFEFFTKKNRISPADISKYQKLRASQGVCGATINRELNFCDAAFNRAVARKLTSRNPFAGFDKFEEQERTRFLSEEELVRLLRAAADGLDRSPHLKDVILTAILTGLRLRAILGLHRDEINFSLGLIKKRPGQSSRNKRAGTIPIPDDLMDMLKSRAQKTDSGYVFENQRTGKPMNNVRKSFKKALETAGIEDFRFHDLRHTFATYALVRSKDIRGVQEILGHKNIQTTQKYTHVLAREKVHIVNGVGEIVLEVLKKKYESDEK